MPPKNPPASQANIDNIMARLTILDSLTEKLEALESLPSRISSLEKLLQESAAKAVALQAEIVKKDKIILDLKTKTNTLSQAWAPLNWILRRKILECKLLPNSV
jgi:hypothetical protein